MVYPNQIPRVDEIIVPGILNLAQTRPSAYSFVQSGGRYADIFVGWKAQARLCIAYLVDQVVSARLGTSTQPMATGEPLTELCRSEFDTDRESSAVAAVGSVSLVRPSGGSGGAIPKGFRFRRDANTSSIPTVPAAIYTVTQDTPVNYAASGPQSFTVPIEASQAGAAANAPVYADSTGTWTLGWQKFTMVDAPFDATIAIASGMTPYEASGGLDTESDDDLIAQASAYATGQYGPTLGAILAGALRGTGAHRVLVRDIYRWTDTGSAAATTGVCLADASWASGPTWLSQVTQEIQSNFQGFGQSIAVTGLQNIPIRVDCAVTVRDANYLASTSAITASIQSAIRSYFDDRPDWYVWRNSPGIYGGLRAAIAAADRRLLTCTEATVYLLSNGSALSQPASPPSAYQQASPAGLQCNHWALVQNGVNADFSAPT